MDFFQKAERIVRILDLHRDPSIRYPLQSALAMGIEMADAGRSYFDVIAQLKHLTGEIDEPLARGLEYHMGK